MTRARLRKIRQRAGAKGGRVKSPARLAAIRKAGEKGRKVLQETRKTDWLQ